MPMKIEQIDFPCGCSVAPQDNDGIRWSLAHCVGHQHPPTPKFTVRVIVALNEAWENLTDRVDIHDQAAFEKMDRAIANLKGVHRETD